jgi:hypothetical protein
MAAIAIDRSQLLTLEIKIKCESIELWKNACAWGAVMEGRSLDILDPLPPGALAQHNSTNLPMNITTKFLEKKN